MTNVLILGGTGWLSDRIARRWRDRGAAVTCLVRGGRPVPHGTTLVAADRDDVNAYRDVADVGWDEVVDISSNAAHVRRAVEALGHRAGHWTYVSSVSVYSDDATIGADESAPLHVPATDGDDEYGPQKVAAENAVRTLGDRATIVRPGLIVGRGDPSDRFGYWAAAFQRAGQAAVLVPSTEGRSVQVIDVEDLAAFIVSMAGTGAVNAIGDVRPLGDVLTAIRKQAGHTGPVVSADDTWLVDRGVGYWMGDRSLPLWLPAEMSGFMTRSNASYRASGGTLRPLEDTIADVIEDERSRGVDRPRRAGLTRADETALLADLASDAR
ncbi:MAG: NAD-dependent epimerase/dehydratase family protein [Actinomycetota bacterium]